MPVARGLIHPVGRTPVTRRSTSVQRRMLSRSAAMSSSAGTTSWAQECAAISCPASCTAATVSGCRSATRPLTPTVAGRSPRRSRSRHMPVVTPYSAHEALWASSAPGGNGHAVAMGA
ncbi:hypothetical protein ADK38_13415 [Streptomyces varsoviensis]|uniref:Uncharacterized protein n=1 Tax=Streptomyces varsoviensis TaxID=67373 RepID=A0ABR5J816_9ACTN|nr:hypothetical protein ADK38_13415 [Streptomyces varsoviensis]